MRSTPGDLSSLGDLVVLLGLTNPLKISETYTLAARAAPGLSGLRPDIPGNSRRAGRPRDCVG